MNLEEAKEKVLQAVKENKIYEGGYEIDENCIIETDFAWYIPFSSILPMNIEDMLVGAYYGFIVGKVSGDLHQPGSAYSIEKWLTGYELGILDGPYDLIITKIKDKLATKKYLQRLNLNYFRPEVESGITWKIPRVFPDKMIEEKLANLPCTFSNQIFHFCIDVFKEIKASKVFEYELIKTADAKENEIGERIE